MTVTELFLHAWQGATMQADAMTRSIGDASTCRCYGRLHWGCFGHVSPSYWTSVFTRLRCLHLFADIRNPSYGMASNWTELVGNGQHLQYHCASVRSGGLMALRTRSSSLIGDQLLTIFSHWQVQIYYGSKHHIWIVFVFIVKIHDMLVGQIV